jgi:insecticidal toxin complex protein TccC
MKIQTRTAHGFTPKLTVTGPRGLAVRSVDYYRATKEERTRMRANRTLHDPMGRAIAQWDPRLLADASAPANVQTVYTLSGAQLSTDSVDAGWRVALLGEAGQSLHHWDGRGSQRWMRYDARLRPVSVYEQAVDGDALCTERLGYGASEETAAEHNQCGQLICHDDPAGAQRFSEFGLNGAVLEQTRHFLGDLTLPDWPETLADRELMLEPGGGATTRSRVNAVGDVIQQTDAKGHAQLFSQTLDGQLREVRLQLNGESTPTTLVSAIAYNTHGQTEREVAGNGVITALEYDAQDGRLTRLLAHRGSEALQDLRYTCDPVGNVLGIEDAAQPIRYFANQRIEPVNRYRYDSLSQLIEATGWEAGSVSKGPQSSTFNDPAPRANYRQTYRYDEGGNLLELIHEGPQSHGHRMVAAAHSNRCLPVRDGTEPGDEDFRRGFDANGNLLHLQPGQSLAWDLRNQLSEVQPVERDAGLNDRERYAYGADGMRLRKVRETHTNARTLIAETRYLPNLELRSNSATGEVLQVISVQAGRSSVRVLHWVSEPPRDSANDQYRYHLNDHLGSCALELDKDGEVISQERYHPYGSTAWFAGRAEVEAKYRTVRYSGKERDATGLYYYGFRYYLAGWQRWLNPDPAGKIDSLNFYCMVINNPVRWFDEYGLSPNTPPALRRNHSVENIPSVTTGEGTSTFAQGESEKVSRAHGSKVSLSVPDVTGKDDAFDLAGLVARVEQSSSMLCTTERKKNEVGAVGGFFSLFRKSQPVSVVTEDDFVAVNIASNGGAPVHGPVNLKKPFDAKRWTMNRQSMIVYRQDNRGIEEIISAGGFQPRGLELDTLEDHMLKSRDYNYVSTSNVRLKGGSFGVYEYKIKLEEGQGIDTGAYLHSLFGAMTKKQARITEFSIPGGISPMQIVGVRKWKK